MRISHYKSLLGFLYLKVLAHEGFGTFHGIRLIGTSNVMLATFHRHQCCGDLGLLQRCVEHLRMGKGHNDIRVAMHDEKGRIIVSS